MRATYAMCSILIVSLSGCADENSSPVFTADDVRILHDYFQSQLAGEEPGTVCHIVSTTVAFEGHELSFVRKPMGLLVALPELEIATLEDFLQKNQESVFIPIDLKLPAGVRHTSDAAVEQLFAEGHLNGAWPRFYELHPDSCGRYSVSRIGHNADNTQAVLSVDYTSGAEVYSACFYIYERIGTEWHLVVAHSPWINCAG